MARKPELKAPYVSKKYLDVFFKLIQRVKLTEINAKILQQYGAASPGNESKMIAALRFLGILTLDGKINEEIMSQLRLEGQTYKSNLQKITREAYSDLFNKVDLLKAKETDILNYFRSIYQYSRSQARAASVLFLFLCRESEIEYSPELIGLGESTLKNRPSNIDKNQEHKQTIKKENLKQSSLQEQSEINKSQRIMSVPEEGYLVTISGKGFSFSQIIKKTSEKEKLKQTIDLHLDFEDNE